MKTVNLPILVTRLNKFIEAVEEARGGVNNLSNSSPLELHLYNIATVTKNQLNDFMALINDFERSREGKQ